MIEPYLSPHRAAVATFQDAPLPDLLRAAAELIEEADQPNVWDVKVECADRNGDNAAWVVSVFTPSPWWDVPVSMFSKIHAECEQIAQQLASAKRTT